MTIQPLHLVIKTTWGSITIKPIEELLPTNYQEIAEIQSFIELGNLNYSENVNNYTFNIYLLLAVLLKNLYDGSLTPQDVNTEQSMCAAELKKNVKRSKYPIKKFWEKFLMEGETSLMVLGVK